MFLDMVCIAIIVIVLVLHIWKIVENEKYRKLKFAKVYEDDV